MAEHICAWCLEPIDENQMGIGAMHIHHDVDKCLKSSNPFGNTLDEEIDEDNPEVLLELMEINILTHELLCEYQLFYHSNCCRRCSQDLAGV